MNRSKHPTVNSEQTTTTMAHINLVITKSESAPRPTEKAVDMVNDYHPFVDFKLVYPRIMPVLENPRDMYLIVLVNSGAKGDAFRDRRRHIRQTWGNHSTCENVRATTDPRIRDLKWILVFVLGKAGPGTDDDDRNIEEARRHNDMLIGDIEDNYLNNIIKLYMGQLWASTFSCVRYTLKTDDDVYVRISGVLQYLSDKGFPRRFYGGATYYGIPVDRRVGGKWAVSRKYFPEDGFPPFNPGAFIILSTDLLPSLFNYIYVRKPFHTDDAYIGVAMRDLKVEVVRVPSFQVTIYENITEVVRKRSNCDTVRLIGVAHKLEPEDSGFLHDRLEALCRENITLKSC